MYVSGKEDSPAEEEAAKNSKFMARRDRALTKFREQLKVASFPIAYSLISVKLLTLLTIAYLAS